MEDHRCWASNVQRSRGKCEGDVRVIDHEEWKDYKISVYSCETHKTQWEKEKQNAKPSSN